MAVSEAELNAMANEMLIGKKKGLNKRALMGRLRGRGLSEQEIKSVFKLVEQAEAKEELVSRIKTLKNKMEKKGVIDQIVEEEEELGELESFETETLPIEQEEVGEEIPEEVTEEIEEGEKPGVSWPKFAKKEKPGVIPKAEPSFKPKVMEVYGAEKKPEARPAEKAMPEAPGRPAEEKPGLGEWLKMKVGRKEEPGVEVTKKASEFAVPGPPQEFEEPVPKAKPKAVPKPEPAPKAVPKPKPVPKVKPPVKAPAKPSKEELKRKEEVEKTLQQAKQAVKDRLFEEVPEAKERIKPVGLGDIIGMVTKPKPKPKARKRKKPKVPSKELKEAAKLIEEAGKMGYSTEESITLLLQAGFSPAVTTAIMRQALKK